MLQLSTETQCPWVPGAQGGKMAMLKSSEASS